MRLANDILDYLSLLLLLINSVAYIVTFKVAKNGYAMQVLQTYLVTTFTLTLVMFIFAIYKENNIYLSHFYFPIQFILLSVFYLLHFNSKQRQVLKGIFIVVLFILGIKYITQPKELFSFSLFEIFITSLPVVLYSIIHLYNSLNKKGAFLYINAAVLIYTTASTLVFFLGNYLGNIAKDVAVNVYFFHKILYIVFLILILIEWRVSHLQYKEQIPS